MKNILTYSILISCLSCNYSKQNNRADIFITTDIIESFPEKTGVPSDLKSESQDEYITSNDIDIFENDEKNISPEQDSDLDGVPDLVENKDGTDPLNPSSAKVWHPELNQHPRLFFTYKDIQMIYLKLISKDSPFSDLASRIRTLADADLPEYSDELYDPAVSAKIGSIVEASAFLGLIESDQKATEKALQGLIMPFPDPTQTVSEKYDLYDAEALVSFCSAWDYLKGNPIADEAKLLSAKANLVKRIDMFRKMVHEGPLFPMLMVSRNNRSIKVVSALGLCALSINDRPEAAFDMSEAMTTLDFLLNQHQGNEHGGYAEGWYYLVYGANSFLPFIYAYHKWAKGKAYPYYGVSYFQPDSPYVDKVVEIKDFASNPTTREIFRAALWSSRPDGLMPNTDDANPSALHGAILYALFNDPDYLWQWFRPASNYYSGRLDTLSFVAYDGTSPPISPSLNLEGSAIEAGFAIFRESWDHDAIYMLVQGEHGDMRINGKGHEHADELNFQLFAWGKPLIIDPGYISWDKHDMVKYATDHNTILVDGKGSPYDLMGEITGLIGVDAYLTNMITQSPFTRVTVKTKYNDVSFERGFTRINKRIFLIDDRMDASGKTHEYSFLLNGMGGGDVRMSSFLMLENGARWEVDGVWVEAVITSTTNDIIFLHDLEEHATSWGNWATHERLMAKAKMDKNAGFLSFIVPGTKDHQYPVSTVKHIAEGVVIIMLNLGETEMMAGLNLTSKIFEFSYLGENISLDHGLNIVLKEEDLEIWKAP